MYYVVNVLYAQNGVHISEVVLVTKVLKVAAGTALAINTAQSDLHFDGLLSVAVSQLEEGVTYHDGPAEVFFSRRFNPKTGEIRDWWHPSAKIAYEKKISRLPAQRGAA